MQERYENLESDPERDLFDALNYPPDTIVRHTPDPLPDDTLEDVAWAFFTRSGEALLRWWRLWGILCLLLLVTPAHATWKPEYEKNPEAVSQWFRNAQVKGGVYGEAWRKLGIAMCCEKAERLRTKFVAVDGREWSYYPDPKCVTKGCELLPIPDYVTHEGEIHAEHAEDDKLPEFDAMRREGVLFIYKGQPSCFWYPRGNDD